MGVAVYVATPKKAPSGDDPQGRTGPSAMLGEALREGLVVGGPLFLLTAGLLFYFLRDSTS
jgi:hypothetical protein